MGKPEIPGQENGYLIILDSDIIFKFKKNSEIFFGIFRTGNIFAGLLAASGILLAAYILFSYLTVYFLVILVPQFHKI